MAIETKVWDIKGISPLLQNNPLAMMQSSDAGGISAGKKVYNNDEEAAIRAYKTEDGLYFHPSEAFRSAMLAACSGRKINKRSAKAIISGSVFPAEHRVLLLDAKGKPIKGFSIHTARVVIGKSGILRARPMYDPWSAKLALEIDGDFIPDPSVVTDLLNIAGRICGVGDYRPDTSKGRSGAGTFGRFSAALAG